MQPDKFERDMRAFCEPILYVVAGGALAFAIVPVLTGGISLVALFGMFVSIPLTCAVMASYAIRRHRYWRDYEAFRIRYRNGDTPSDAVWINAPPGVWGRDTLDDNVERRR